MLRLAIVFAVIALNRRGPGFLRAKRRLRQFREVLRAALRRSLRGRHDRGNAHLRRTVNGLATIIEPNQADLLQSPPDRPACRPAGPKCGALHRLSAVVLFQAVELAPGAVAAEAGLRKRAGQGEGSLAVEIIVALAQGTKDAQSALPGNDFAPGAAFGSVRPGAVLLAQLEEVRNHPRPCNSSNRDCRSGPPADPTAQGPGGHRPGIAA